MSLIAAPPAPSGRCNKFAPKPQASRGGEAAAAATSRLSAAAPQRPVMPSRSYSSTATSWRSISAATSTSLAHEPPAAAAAAVAQQLQLAAGGEARRWRSWRWSTCAALATTRLTQERSLSSRERSAASCCSPGRGPLREGRQQPQRGRSGSPASRLTLSRCAYWPGHGPCQQQHAKRLHMFRSTHCADFRRHHHDAQVVEGSAEEGKLQAALAAAGVPGSRVTRARVLETRPSASYGTLSLIEVTVAPGYSGGSALCRALASLGHPVVGAVLPRLAGPPSPAPRASAGQGSARRGSGEAVGAHLALIRLRFPAELEAELYAAAGPGGRHGPGGDAEGGGAAEAALLEAAVEVPKKFLKTLRREARASPQRRL